MTHPGLAEHTIAEYLARAWSSTPVRTRETRPPVLWDPVEHRPVDDRTARRSFHIWPQAGFVTRAVSELYPNGIVLDVVGIRQTTVGWLAALRRNGSRWLRERRGTGLLAAARSHPPRRAQRIHPDAGPAPRSEARVFLVHNRGGESALMNYRLWLPYDTVDSLSGTLALIVGVAQQQDRVTNRRRKADTQQLGGNRPVDARAVGRSGPRVLAPAVPAAGPPPATPSAAKTPTDLELEASA